MNTESNKSKFFYGWVIVFAGALISATSIGIGWNSFGQFIKPICADLGFSRQAMSTTMTVLSLMQMVINFFWGYIFKRFSLKKMLRLAAVVFPAAYFCFSLSQKIWMFYLCAVFMGFSMPVLTTLSFAVIVSNWFHEKKGTAIGLAFMGTGIGGMIFNPVAAALIEGIGWRWAIRLLAGIMFSVINLTLYALVRIRPEEKGLLPLGEKTAVPEDPDKLEGMLFKDLIKTWRFRLVCVCVCFATTAIGCMTQCMAPHLTDSGYSAASAALMVSVNMAALAAGKMLLGIIFDKAGLKRASQLSVFCGALGLLGMILCKNPMFLPFIIIGQCLGSSFGTVAVPILAQGLFGKRDYSTNFGVMSACSSVGNALSPTINGGVYDRMGSYNPAFCGWLSLLCVAFAVFTAILPKGKKEGAEA